MCVFIVDKLCKCLIIYYEICSKLFFFMYDIFIRDILSFMCGVWFEKCKGFFYLWLFLCKYVCY